MVLTVVVWILKTYNHRYIVSLLLALYGYHFHVIVGYCMRWFFHMTACLLSVIFLSVNFISSFNVLQNYMAMLVLVVTYSLTLCIHVAILAYIRFLIFKDS